MNDSDYDKLKLIIQQANPEIVGNWSGCPVCNMMCDVCEAVDGDAKRPRPIRLADVLLAIDKYRDPRTAFTISTNGLFLEREKKKVTARVFDSRSLSTLASWNLRDDNLDHQSDFTKEFLIELLIK